MRARDPLRVSLAAVSFLTVVPVARRLAFDADDIRRSGIAFPVVGAAIGATVALVATTISHVAPALMAAAIGVGAGTLLTGGLHVDALADAADGLGGRTRSDALRIMRDHSIGSFGATALVIDLLVKVTAVGAVVTAHAGYAALIAAGALSRATSPALAAALRYAQPQPGAGAALSAPGAAPAAIATVGIGAGIGLVAAGGAHGAAMIAGCLCTSAIVAAVANRRLGGITGDVLGAAIELAETTMLVIVAVAVT